MPQFHKVDLSSGAKIICACLVYPLVLVLTTLLSCQLRENCCLHDHRVNFIWEMCVKIYVVQAGGRANASV